MSHHPNQNGARHIHFHTVVDDSENLDHLGAKAPKVKVKNIGVGSWAFTNSIQSNVSSTDLLITNKVDITSSISITGLISTLNNLDSLSGGGEVTIPANITLSSITLPSRNPFGLGEQTGFINWGNYANISYQDGLYDPNVSDNNASTIVITATQVVFKHPDYFADGALISTTHLNTTTINGVAYSPNLSIPEHITTTDITVSDFVSTGTLYTTYIQLSNNYMNTFISSITSASMYNNTDGTGSGIILSQSNISTSFVSNQAILTNNYLTIDNFDFNTNNSYNNCITGSNIIVTNSYNMTPGPSTIINNCGVVTTDITVSTLTSVNTMNNINIDTLSSLIGYWGGGAFGA